MMRARLNPVSEVTLAGSVTIERYIIATGRVKTVELKTPRLVLRPLVVADCESMHRYRSLPEVWRYQHWAPAATDEISEFIADQAAIEPDTPGTWYQLAITVRSSGDLVGDCGLHFHEHDSHQTEFGITVAPEHQGQGYATEAAQALLAYLFGTLGKHRVFASADPRNTPSLRLMERLGMRQEAHFRESVLIRDEWTDDVICAMLRREWNVATADR